MADRRKHKRIVNHLSKKIGQTQYFEDCNYHPCKLTNMEVYYGGTDGDIIGTSLITGNSSSCSILNCGPHPITEKEAFERRDYRIAHGKEAYMIKYVFGDSKEALEHWRELDAVWNFR